MALGIAEGVCEVFGGTVKTATDIYYPKYTGNSYGIDTVFKAIGVPDKFLGSYKNGGYKNRKDIAKANGILNYKGRYEENVKLVSLAKQGKLKKV